MRMHDFGRFAVAILLCTAAALKGYDLATVPPAADGGFGSFWVSMGIIQFEVFLGAWLLLGVNPRAASITATWCFAAFALYSLSRILIGDRTCGCFGPVQVNPWYTLMLDLGVLGVLSRWRPPVQYSPLLPLRIAWIVPTAVVAAGLGGAAIASRAPILLTANGSLGADGQVVVLKPSDWVGRRLPLLQYIRCNANIQNGEYVLVLYHHDCGDCAEIVPDYVSASRELAALPGAPSIVMIEVPPYAKTDRQLVGADEHYATGTLSDVNRWFVKTPVVLCLADGVVQSVEHDPLAPLRRLTAVTESSLSDQDGNDDSS